MGPVKNTVVREIAPKSIFEDATKLVNSSLSYEQGDLLVWDGTAKLLKVPTLEADGATFLGIARQKLVSGQPQSPYQGTAVDAAQKTPALAGPLYGVVARCVAKTGDAFAKGDLVYLDPATGGRGVSSAGTKAIGVYQGDTIASATAGQEIEVLIGARHPGDVLQF